MMSDTTRDSGAPTRPAFMLLPPVEAAVCR
jgi:hypothetical protein